MRPIKSDDNFWLILIGVVLLILVIGVAFTGLSALILMWAWNVLVPLTGLPELSFWPAVAITVLISLISGAFRTTITRSKE